MKTILVPTDFSKSAQNALDYAIEIAKYTSAKLILFHTYQLPVVISEVPVVLSDNEIERQIIRNLKKAERHILNNNPGLTVQYEYRNGFAVEEIKLCTERNNVDLIIIGLHGSGFLKEKLIGSVSTALMNNSKCPVMVINQNAKFKGIKNIALAFDYTEIKNKSILIPLNKLTHIFKSHIFIFNVVKSQLEPVSSISKAMEGMKLAHALGDSGHSFHYSEDEDIIEGINKFVLAKNIDMVVMIPHKHSLFYNLFNESQTKKMAFHGRIPLLTLNESHLSK
jgi:nucleotide-binding universal stress UspA family protein